MVIWIYDSDGRYPEKWESARSRWIELPPTTRETDHIISSYVNDSRNEYGAIIGQIVGRANLKMDNLEWKMLPIETVSMILNLVKPKRTAADVNERTFKFNMRIPNLFEFNEQTGTLDYIEITAYSGDSHFKPYWLTKNGRNYRVGDLKVNLIDCGYANLLN